MNNNDNIGNDELLYRRVKKHTPNLHPNDCRYRLNRFGDLEVLPMAFYDKKNEPSVDRASKHNNDPSKTQGDMGNGVIKLLARDVRDMKIDYHEIDIKPDPFDENPAHSRIIMTPNVNEVSSDMQKRLRQKFRENLAHIANQLGWVIDPAF